MTLLVLGSRYRVVLLLFIHSICLLLFPFCGCLVLGLFRVFFPLDLMRGEMIQIRLKAVRHCLNAFRW